ncbi:hypothetical protein BD410DRAFT_432064 [Rickenella mellea]|uniref:F-box domain-containing protein n=1 Tax=Rickenella mellea TaxID=50990 RepID=A0A4Y7PVY2_9AGAM|nr:hypothetical protein BD410DRAFT_432064 [Rickenella mellea]
MDIANPNDQGNGIIRLPEDVLHIIFSNLRETELASTIHGRRWIVVSHVCHKWRQVALASTNLWTIVDTSWGSNATEFIRRSGTAPLKLWIGLTASASDSEIETFNLAIDHISRACELHFSLGAESIHMSRTLSLTELWKKETLATISLRNPYRGQIPHLHFNDIPPVLKVLETTMAYVSNQATLLRQLTYLKIDIPQYSPMSASEMLGVLGSCVQLVGFEFSHRGPVSAPLSGTATVTLPSLRRLCLSFGSADSMDFLCHLTFLPEVSLALKSTICFKRPRIPPELYSQYDSCELQISMSVICLSSRTSTAKGQKTMDVKFRHTVNGTALMQGLGILQFSFPSLLVHLKTITIAPLPPTSSTTGFRWEELLRKLTNLSTLVVRGRAPGRRGFVGPLANALSRPNEFMQPFCPNLRTLMVENFALYPITVQRSLVKFVASRDEMGARLGMLDISRCTELEPTIFDELAPFVDEVVRPSPSTPLIE